MKIAIKEIIKLIKRIISIDEPNVEAQPGIASTVTVLMTMIVAIAKTENSINKNEIIATLVIMISRKTEIAPNPCNNKEVKFILELPE